MGPILAWLEQAFASLPLPLLEAWGRVAYFLGALLAVAAFGGFTFRPGGRWGLGRESQAWDAKAILSMPITFSLIVLTGYLGSFVVLVPGAQTLESLKDLVVFEAILLFGYPALLTVPFAYGLSDLIEGVPPAFLLDWLPGYFINPACFWIAYQLFGKDPDFRRARTWGLYAGFVAAFMAVEPLLWGHLCAEQFTAPVSYRHISAALVFTTGLTWCLAPFTTLALLPLARRGGFFWADIPGHVKERLLGARDWIWQSGGGQGGAVQSGVWPLRMVLLAPFIALILLMVGSTAYVTLRSAAQDATKLAGQLHDEISANIDLLLDEQLRRGAAAGTPAAISALLAELPVARRGLAMILDKDGAVFAGSKGPAPVAAQAVATLALQNFTPAQRRAGAQFRFDHVSERPLSRVTWLANAMAYKDPQGLRAWTILTVLPESYYLAGVQAGHSRSAMVFSAALVLAVLLAALLAAAMTGGLSRIAEAAQALAGGDFSRRLPGSRLRELDDLAGSFNFMATKLDHSVGALRTNEARLSQEMRFIDTLMNSLPGVVSLIDPQGGILKWNKALEEASGYDAAELARLSPFQLIPPEQADSAGRAIEAALSLGRSELELPLLAKDGFRLPYYFKVARLDTDAGPRLLSIGLDISGRLRLEEQLLQAQKMEAVGNLAGGIAHDFNNMLTVILGSADLLKQGLPPADPRHAEAADIMATAQRAAELTRQLLAFSRRQLLQPRVFDLNDSVRSMEKMLRRLLRENISLDCAPAPGPLRCTADPSQVEQAILNLALNARDAMPRGGKLSLATRAVTLDEAGCREHPGARPGSYAEVSVTDTGQGMVPEVLARVFEPFFTTKEAGQGTGLGLAMVYGTAQQSGGHVEASSTPGQGSCFRLYLPAAADGQAAPAQAAAAKPQPDGTETVLLVEDEEALLRLATRALERFGYKVVTAADGEEALRILTSHVDANIDILVTDVVMPGLSGPELGETARKMRPGLPVLYVSGHADEDVAQFRLDREGLHFLQKPYTLAELGQKLREILDHKA